MAVRACQEKDDSMKIKKCSVKIRGWDYKTSQNLHANTFYPNGFMVFYVENNSKHIFNKYLVHIFNKYLVPGHLISTICKNKLCRLVEKAASAVLRTAIISIP